MEDKQMLVKTIKKSFDSKIKAGITWFKFITAINNIKLPQREIELLAFINNRGTISSTSAKTDFCLMFDTSVGTISNMTGRLMRKKLLIKDSKKKVRVSPALAVDFNNDFLIKFFINVKEPEKN